MGTCKLRRFIDGYVVNNTCDEIRMYEEAIKSAFREENKTEEMIKMIGKDKVYENFCSQIDNFLNNCQCQKPKQESQITKNIREAKERRDKSEFLWKNNNKKENHV